MINITSKGYDMLTEQLAEAIGSEVDGDAITWRPGMLDNLTADAFPMYAEATVGSGNVPALVSVFESELLNAIYFDSVDGEVFATVKRSA